MNEQEITEAKQKLKRYRVHKNFDQKYGDKGGVDQLLRMANNNDTLEDMSAWFGITVSRLSVLLTDILGMPYSTYLASKQVSRSGVVKNDQ